MTNGGAGPVQVGERPGGGPAGAGGGRRGGCGVGALLQRGLRHHRAPRQHPAQQARTMDLHVLAPAAPPPTILHAAWSPGGFLLHGILHNGKAIDC